MRVWKSYISSHPSTLCLLFPNSVVCAASACPPYNVVHESFRYPLHYDPRGLQKHVLACYSLRPTLRTKIQYVAAFFLRSTFLESKVKFCSFMLSLSRFHSVAYMYHRLLAALRHRTQFTCRLGNVDQCGPNLFACSSAYLDNSWEIIFVNIVSQFSQPLRLCLLVTLLRPWTGCRILSS